MKKRRTWMQWILSLALLSGTLQSSYADKIQEPPRELAHFESPSPCKPEINAAENHPLNSTPAEALGWVTTDDPLNVCHGYFIEPVTLTENPSPGDIEGKATTITAATVTRLVANGESVLEGRVVLTQTGRIVKADKAYINRNAKTGEISSVELFQHVSYEEHGKRILGSHAFLNLEDNSLTVDHVLYHLYTQETKKETDSWGEATQFKKLASGELELDNATYSAASPTKPAWQIKAKKLLINDKEGWGKAYHSTLRVFNKPILYLPYYSFPTNKERKSGFLTPSMGHSQQSGWDIGLPLYLNLAPNYDWLFTPHLLTERGVQYDNSFRYLFNKGGDLKADGSLYFSYLPNDKQFQNFKNQMIALYPPTTSNQPYLNQLNSDSDNRGYISSTNHWLFDKNWESNLTLNYVTDAYYFEDFGSSGGFGAANAGNTLTSQLLNQYDIRYSGEHWNFTALVQAYQTLHPINQPANTDQYRRLPEFDLNGNYPDQWHGLGLSLESQAVNFAYQSDFTPNQPVGQRFHLRPGVNLPINWSSGYITPELLWDTTAYAVQQPQPGQATSITRNIPLVNIDSGIYLDRQFDLASHHFTQTLEPEVFYLYVPYQNQNQIPVFDTQLQPFTISQLFVTNAFTGFDRIQNANQVSIGLSSRLLDAETSLQKLSASVGMINYFQKPQVCLTSNCPPVTENFSPIVGQLSFNPTSEWTASANLAWDPNLNQTNNGSLNLAYNDGHNRTTSVAYQFVQGTNGSANSDSIQAGASWPIAYHWSALGYLNYNITQIYTQGIYGGLEYEGCGWALRFISSSNYIGTLPTGNQYNMAYYIQLELTGLANIGTDPAALLATLPGYQNRFSN